MAYDFSNIAYIKKADGTEIKTIKRGSTTLWTKPYVWAKYNTITTSTEQTVYTAVKDGTYEGEYDGFEFELTLYKDYSINQEDGTFTGITPYQVDFVSELSYAYGKGYIYAIENDNQLLIKYTKMSMSEADSINNYYLVEYRFSEYVTEEETDIVEETSKSSYIENISATSNTYPTDGISGNYWYILISSPNTAGFTMPSTYTVTTVPGASYGFSLNGNGYYESQNAGINNSYSLCQVNIIANGKDRLYIDCINGAEGGSWDFGILSNLNTNLSTSNTADNSNVKYSFSGSDSGYTSATIDYGVLAQGNHYIQIKYRKDGSVNTDPDSLQFKVRFE